MNDILKKAIEELKAEKPRIDYVLGMLETLYEMQAPKIAATGGANPPPAVSAPGPAATPIVVKKPVVRRHDDLVEEIRKLREKGKDSMEIAEALNVNPSTVDRLWDEAAPDGE